MDAQPGSEVYENVAARAAHPGQPGRPAVYPVANRQFALKQQNVTFQLTQHIQRQQRQSGVAAGGGSQEGGGHTPASRVTDDQGGGVNAGEIGLGEAQKMQRIVERRRKATNRGGNVKQPGDSLAKQLA